MLSIPTLWTAFVINFVTMGLIWAYVMKSYPKLAAARYWTAEQSRESALVGARLFDWSNFIVSVVSITMNLLVGFLLVRWLYAEDKTPGGDQEVEAPSAEPAP